MKANTLTDIRGEKAIVLSSHPPVVVTGSIKGEGSLPPDLKAGTILFSRGTRFWYAARDNGDDKMEGVLLEDAIAEQTATPTLARVLVHGAVDNRFVIPVENKTKDTNMLRECGIYKR